MKKKLWHSENEEPCVSRSNAGIVVQNENGVDKVRYGKKQKDLFCWKAFCVIHNILNWAYWDDFVKSVKKEVSDAN